jgi:hypothetical protein
MNCKECQNLLAEYAIDTLEPNAQRRVATHLSNGCVDCREQLREINEAWATLTDTLSTAAPPASLKQELLSRVKADQMPRLSSEMESVLPAKGNAETTLIRTRSALAFSPYIAASLIGILAGYWFASNAPSSSTKLVQEYHAHISESQRLFGKDQVYLASLQFSEKQPGGEGHLVEDAVTRQLHCYAFGLGELAEGAVFRLWFVSSEDEWQPVGDLKIQPGGLGIAVLSRPQALHPWVRAVVTMEEKGPGAALEKPRGPVRLSGEFRLP